MEPPAFTGEMVNDSDADQRFELNVFLQYGQGL